MISYLFFLSDFLMETGLNLLFIPMAKHEIDLKDFIDAYNEPLPTDMFYIKYSSDVYCYLVLDEGVLPIQPNQITYKNKVYVYLTKTYGFTTIEKYIVLAEYNKVINNHIRDYIHIDLIKEIVKGKIDNISWCYKFIIGDWEPHGDDVNRPTLMLNYIKDTKKYPRYENQVEYIVEACYHCHPDYKDEVDKIYELYKQCSVNLDKFEGVKYCKTMFDVLLKLTECGGYKLCIPIHLETEKVIVNYVYVSNPMIDLNRAFDKYPNINNDIIRIKWLLDSIMPYAIYNALSHYYYPSEKLYHVAGLIGLWSVLTESGTGSNSWFLTHPCEFGKFKEFIHNVLKYKYEDVAAFFGVSIYKQIPKFDILVDVNLDIFQSLDESIKFIKSICRMHNLKKLYNIQYDNNELIPSPSGMTIIPFVFDEW